MPTVAIHPQLHPAVEEHEHLISQRTTRYLVPLGRLTFALMFLLAAPGHFRGATIDYAASQGVPLANFLVPASGVLALIGGISVLLGLEARFGAFLLVVFLVPVTFMMHKFWLIADAQEAMIQRVMFLKNLSMLGGALLLMHFGPGPISLDAKKHRMKFGEPKEPTRLD